MPLIQPSLTLMPGELLAQTSASEAEASTNLSFGEVLKVEEKKLQEQAINTANLAAILATIQPPTLTPPANVDAPPAFIPTPPITASIPTPTAGEAAPALSTLKATPGQKPPLQAEPVVQAMDDKQETSPSEKVTVNETNIPATREQVTNNQATRTDAPAAKIAQSADTVIVNEMNFPATREQATSYQATRTNAPAAKITQPADKVIVNETNIPATSEQVTSNQATRTDVPAAKIAQPADKVIVNETNIPATREQATRDQAKRTDVPAAKIIQPADKVIVKEANFPAMREQATSNQAARTDVPAAKITQPADKVIVNDTNVPATREQATSNQTTRTDAPAAKMAQSADKAVVNETNIPAAMPEDENRFESAIRLPVENEAVVGGQEAARVKGNAWEDESDAGVGNHPKEKETFEVDAEPVAFSTSQVADVKPAVTRMMPPMDVDAFEVVQQVVSQLKARGKNGETSIKVQLNPKELGAIEVEVTRDARGVSVNFAAEKIGTSQLLESHVEQLRQSLKEAGVQLSNLNVGQQYHEEGGDANRQSFVQSEPREMARETVPKAPQTRQTVGGLTEIDYLV